MNHFQPPPRGGLQRIFRMLSLLLLQHALTPGITDAQARTRLPSSGNDGNPASRPYLKISALVIPLRFNSPPPPPPDLTSKPSAGAPPQEIETTLADNPGVTAAVSTSAAPVAAPEAPATTNPTQTPGSTEPGAPVPSAILPDDTRVNTRAEDFLPFFQFPTSNGDVTVVVPATAPRATAPGQMPLSSATYQQK